MIIIGIILGLISSFFGALQALFLKKCSIDFCLNIKKLFKNKNLMIAVGLFFLGLLFYIPALKFADLSLIFPLGSLAYVFTVLLSVKYLGEKMTAYRWIAIILIVSGVSLIGLGYSI
jgi:drug/metabolite transporter (DMT)-like permease